MAGPYAQWAPLYKERGLEPRPIQPGTKACYVDGWQEPMDDETFANSLKTHAQCGIGLLMGSPFPDGTRLGAIDVDDDRYTRPVHFLLAGPPVGRVGKKGAAFFVRVKGNPTDGTSANPEFRVPGHPKLGKVVECLFVKKLCVIPPTIHPETEAPYRWIGKTLLDVYFEELPLLDLSS